jgi:hypothetical protein
MITDKTPMLSVPAPGTFQRTAIWGLMDLLPASLERIAPTRLAALVEAVQGLTLNLMPELRWVCEYDPDSKTISISQRAVECLWCASYAYYMLYKNLAEGKQFDSPVERVLTEIPALANPLARLRWALDDVVFQRLSPWPEEQLVPVPLPEAGRPIVSPEVFASEICLVATAYVLHHELAHHHLRHSKSTPETEFEADNNALDWILLDSSAGPLPIQKRGLGVVVANTVLAALDLYQSRAHRKSAERPGRSHPPGYRRWFNALLRHFDDPNDVVWGFALVALMLHLEHLRIRIAKGPYDTFYAAADALVETLTEVEQAQLKR